MDLRARPLRSVLYLPASNVRALEKAANLPCDAIIFDLEDAVAADEKPRARETLAAALRGTDYGPRARIVRINALSSLWGAADVAAMSGLPVDAVLIPKDDGPQDVQAVADLVPDVPLWAMMETPRGCLNAAAIAAHPRLTGFVMGTNDLAKDMGARFHPDRLPMQTALGLCLLAARAEGIVAIDGVYNALRDDEGLRAECDQGRDLGFDGKTLIHPAQLGIANVAFAPSSAEVDLARRQIAAWTQAQAEGRGVTVVDGRIVENLHIDTARRTLARTQAISDLEASLT